MHHLHNYKPIEYFNNIDTHDLQADEQLNSNIDQVLANL